MNAIQYVANPRDVLLVGVRQIHGVVKLHAVTLTDWDKQYISHVIDRNDEQESFSCVKLPFRDVRLELDLDWPAARMVLP